MNEPTTRKARRSAMSDDGRLILQRERQRIAREQAVLGERLANEARRSERRQDLNARRANPEEAAVQRGIVKRIAAVLASESVNVRLDVASAGSMTAWTDFQRIHVRYRQHEDKRLVAAVLRGLMFHEAGHCRWSDPFPELQDMVKDKHHLIPGLIKTNDEGEALVIDWKRLQRSWNALEDQRMETAVVTDSPVKALYLTPMMMTELMETPEHARANWPLLVWRRYLPRKLRAAARRDFVALHGEALARRFEAVVDTYVRSNDAVEMMTAVVEMADLLDIANIVLDDFGHDRQVKRRREVIRDENGDDITPPQEPTPIPLPDMFEEDEAEDDDEDWGENPTGDTVSEGTPGEADDSEAEQPTVTGPAGDHADDSNEDSNEVPKAPEPDLKQEDIDSAKAEAEAERDADTTLDDDVESFHHAMEDQVSDLAPYVGGISTDDAATNEAEILASEIERSFQAATMDRQPAWVEQQHRGIINVARYETARMAQDGTTDFYRDWVEDDQPGFNMAVSLMLDYSSSMNAYEQELSQVGYAVKLACQKLDIPCTVTLWDTDATVLYDATEQAEGMPSVKVAGATNPTPALADLDNQRFDKVNHIVLIMTDGEWQGEWGSTHNDWGGGRKRAQADKATLAYHANDRVMVGFGFAKYEPTAKRYAENLIGYGCPEAFGITNLMEIPERLREILIALA